MLQNLPRFCLPIGILLRNCLTLWCEGIPRSFDIYIIKDNKGNTKIRQRKVKEIFTLYSFYYILGVIDIRMMFRGQKLFFFSRDLLRESKLIVRRRTVSANIDRKDSYS